MPHAEASVGDDVTLGEGVVLGSFAVIGDGVTLGAGTRIGSHAVIQEGTRLCHGVAGKDRSLLTI